LAREGRKKERKKDIVWLLAVVECLAWPLPAVGVGWL